MSLNKVIEIQTIDFAAANNDSIKSSEINDRLTNLENNVNSLKEEMDKTSTNETFESKLVAIQQDVVLLNYQLDSAIKNSNTKLNHEVNRVQNSISNLRDELNLINLTNISNNTSKLEDSEITTKFSNLEEKLNLLASKVNDIDIVSNTIKASVEKGIEVNVNNANVDTELITKNMLELDMEIKNNSLEIQNIKKNMGNTNINSVENVINDLIDEKLSTIITQLSSFSININNLKTMSENQSKILADLQNGLSNINQRLEIVENKQNNQHEETVEEKQEETVEEQQEEETVEEQQEEETVEEQQEEETVEEKQEETVEEKQEETVEEKQEETVEEKQEETVEEQQTDEDLKQLIQNEIEVYPTSGFTFYGFYEGNTYDLTLGIFIKKDGKYELRGKQTAFKAIANRIFISINIQLEKDQTEFLLARYHKGVFERYNKNLDVGVLKIGENNLDANLDALPIINFE